MAKAYIIPTAEAGVLLTTIAIVLVYANLTGISIYEEDFNKDAPVFIQSEIDRIDGTAHARIEVYKNKLVEKTERNQHL